MDKTKGEKRKRNEFYMSSHQTQGKQEASNGKQTNIDTCMCGSKTFRPMA